MFPFPFLAWSCGTGTDRSDEESGSAFTTNSVVRGAKLSSGSPSSSGNEGPVLEVDADCEYE